MDYILLFIKGVIMGLLGSIPLGPIGILCIQRTLSKRFYSGFYSGLGAATADTLFAIIAIFFLSIVMAFIESRMQLLTVLGGIIIMVIGVSIYTKKSALHIRNNRAQSNNYLKDYISTLFLTLTNPAYIFVFIALFATMGINSDDLSIVKSLAIIAGVFTGAGIWWLTLTYSINKLRNKFRTRHLIIMNKVAGGVIFGLGIAAVIGAVFKTELEVIEKFISGH